jgi:tetratricopeptide (TPR) repeat protein
MKPAPSAKAASLARIFVAVSACCVLFATSGCEEFNARRKIQEAGKLYDKGKYDEAAATYEEALQIAPDLEIGHHNAALAYRQMFLRAQADPDAKEEEVKALANKAANHFLAYLETDPDDGQIIGLTTKLWLDSGQHPKAIEFWEGRLAKDPKSNEVLGILAGINRQAGNWERAVEYYGKQADVEKLADDKAAALSNIAKMAWHKLKDREKVVGTERVRIADMGIAALQRAEKIDVSLKVAVEVQTYLYSLYNFRAMAHAASWARAADEASAQYHQLQFTQLREKLKALEEEELNKIKEGEGPAGEPEGSKG